MEPIPIIIYLSIQDLLAVRKIPLKGRSYLGPVGDGGMVVASSPGTSTSNGPTIDPAARELRREMQRIVTKDRDLYERISSSFIFFLIAFASRRQSGIPSLMQTKPVRSNVLLLLCRETRRKLRHWPNEMSDVNRNGKTRRGLQKLWLKRVANFARRRERRSEIGKGNSENKENKVPWEGIPLLELTHVHWMMMKMGSMGERDTQLDLILRETWILIGRSSREKRRQ